MQHYTVALAGNPNVGKSTLFNALTGLRQHTGNWPGKTVTRAQGSYTYQGYSVKLVDLPGTYSLFTYSPEEEVTRTYIQSGQGHVVLVVLDATALERNLNLALQIMLFAPRILVCLNFMDEVARLGLRIDVDLLATALGVPVIAATAREKQGLTAIRAALHEVALGSPFTPLRVTLPAACSALFTQQSRA